MNEYAQNLIRFYGESLAEHYGKDNAKAVRWGSAEHQRIHYSALLSASHLRPGMSVVDVGCGLGDLVEFEQEWLQKEHYLGIDIVPDMVTHARELHPGWRFEVCDIAQPTVGLEADLLISSGVMGTLSENAQNHVIGKMWSLAKIGIAFNVSSTWAEHDPGHAVRDPAEMLNFCHRFTRLVAVHHEYFFHIYTVAMFKEAAA